MTIGNPEDSLSKGFEAPKQNLDIEVIQKLFNDIVTAMGKDGEGLATTNKLKAWLKRPRKSEASRLIIAVKSFIETNLASKTKPNKTKIETLTQLVEEAEVFVDLLSDQMVQSSPKSTVPTDNTFEAAADLSGLISGGHVYPLSLAIGSLKNSNTMWELDACLENEDAAADEMLDLVQGVFLGDDEDMDREIPLALQKNSGERNKSFRGRISDFYNKVLLPDYHLHAQIYKLHRVYERDLETINQESSQNRPVNKTQQKQGCQQKFRENCEKLVKKCKQETGKSYDISLDPEDHSNIVPVLKVKVRKIYAVESLLEKLGSQRVDSNKPGRKEYGPDPLSLNLENLFGLNRLFETLENKHKSQAYDRQLSDLEEFFKSPNDYNDYFGDYIVPNTFETELTSELNLDDSGGYEIASSIVCWENMVANFGRYKEDIHICCNLVFNSKVFGGIDQLVDAHTNLSIFQEHVLPGILLNLKHHLSNLEKLIGVSHDINKKVVNQEKLKLRIKSIRLFLETTKYLKEFTDKLQNETVNIVQDNQIPHDQSVYQNNQELFENIWGVNFDEEYEYFPEEDEIVDDIDEEQEAQQQETDINIEKKVKSKGWQQFPRKLYPKIPKLPLSLDYQKYPWLRKVNSDEGLSQKFTIPNSLNDGYNEEIFSEKILLQIATNLLLSRYKNNNQRQNKPSVPIDLILKYLLRFKDPESRYVNAEVISSLGRLEILEKVLYRGLFYPKLQEFIQSGDTVSQLFYEIYGGVKFVQTGAPKTTFPNNLLPVVLMEMIHARTYFPKVDSVYTRLKLKSQNNQGLDQQEAQYLEYIENTTNKLKIPQVIKNISYYFAVLDKGDKPDNVHTRALYEGLLEVLESKKEMMSQTQVQQMEDPSLSSSQLLVLISTFGLNENDIAIINQHLAYKTAYITYSRDKNSLVELSQSEWEDHPETPSLGKIRHTKSVYTKRLLVIPNIAIGGSNRLLWSDVLVREAARDTDGKVIYDPLTKKPLKKYARLVPKNPTGHFLKVEQNGKQIRIMSPRYSAGGPGTPSNLENPSQPKNDIGLNPTLVSTYQANNSNDESPISTVKPRESKEQNTSTGGEYTTFELKPEEAGMSMADLIYSKTGIKQPRKRDVKKSKSEPTAEELWQADIQNPQKWNILATSIFQEFLDGDIFNKTKYNNFERIISLFLGLISENIENLQLPDTCLENSNDTIFINQFLKTIKSQYSDNQLVKVYNFDTDQIETAWLEIEEMMDIELGKPVILQIGVEVLKKVKELYHQQNSNLIKISIEKDNQKYLDRMNANPDQKSVRARLEILKLSSAVVTQGDSSELFINQKSILNQNLQTAKRFEEWFDKYTSENQISSEVIGQENYELLLEAKKTLLENLDFADYIDLQIPELKSAPTRIDQNRFETQFLDLANIYPFKKIGSILKKLPEKYEPLNYTQISNDEATAIRQITTQISAPFKIDDTLRQEYRAWASNFNSSGIPDSMIANPPVFAQLTFADELTYLVSIMRRMNDKLKAEREEEQKIRNIIKICERSSKAASELGNLTDRTNLGELKTISSGFVATLDPKRVMSKFVATEKTKLKSLLNSSTPLGFLSASTEKIIPRLKLVTSIEVYILQAVAGPKENNFSLLSQDTWTTLLETLIEMFSQEYDQISPAYPETIPFLPNQSFTLEMARNLFGEEGTMYFTLMKSMMQNLPTLLAEQDYQLSQSGKEKLAEQIAKYIRQDTTSIEISSSEQSTETTTDAEAAITQKPTTLENSDTSKPLEISKLSELTIPVEYPKNPNLQDLLMYLRCDRLVQLIDFEADNLADQFYNFFDPKDKSRDGLVEIGFRKFIESVKDADKKHLGGKYTPVIDKFLQPKSTNLFNQALNRLKNLAKPNDDQSEQELAGEILQIMKQYFDTAAKYASDPSVLTLADLGSEEEVQGMINYLETLSKSENEMIAELRQHGTQSRKMSVLELEKWYTDFEIDCINRAESIERQSQTPYTNILLIQQLIRRLNLENSQYLSSTKSLEKIKRGFDTYLKIALSDINESKKKLLERVQLKRENMTTSHKTTKDLQNLFEQILRQKQSPVPVEYEELHTIYTNIQSFTQQIEQEIYNFKYSPEYVTSINLNDEEETNHYQKMWSSVSSTQDLSKEQKRYFDLVCRLSYLDNCCTKEVGKILDACYIQNAKTPDDSLQRLIGFVSGSQRMKDADRQIASASTFATSQAEKQYMRIIDKAVQNGSDKFTLAAHTNISPEFYLKIRKVYTNIKIDLLKGFEKSFK